MFTFVKNFFFICFEFLKLPIFIVVVLLSFFVFSCFCFYVFYSFKGLKRKKSERIKLKKDTFLKKIFYLLPSRLVLDYLNGDPDRFPYKGVIIFTGRQGNGKTISLVQAINEMQKEYPKSKVITNLNYCDEDDSLYHWKQLTDYTNGKYGVIVGMDETQNWFSSSQSKNFPPEMLSVITQNRKNARIILGTAQSFHLLAKSIRSQCTEVRECRTLLGCLTIVRRREPILDPDGNVVEYKRAGSTYFYVHSKKLREMYDTYFTVNSLSLSGFINNSNNDI